MSPVTVPSETAPLTCWMPPFVIHPLPRETLPGTKLASAVNWVFDVGASVPRFDIRTFERSHGLRIYTDGSHPSAIEVEETEPFWLSNFRRVTEQFGQEIKEHLKLIKTWRREAQSRLKNNGAKTVTSGEFILFLLRKLKKELRKR